jgi:hypothetical protein
VRKLYTIVAHDFKCGVPEGKIYPRGKFLTTHSGSTRLTLLIWKWLCLICLLTFTLRATPVQLTVHGDSRYLLQSSRTSESPTSDDISPFEITLSDLGYQERSLKSPYDLTEYTLRLPAHWELRLGSFLELDFSYTYDYTGVSEREEIPFLFAQVSVFIDGEKQRTIAIRQRTLEHSRLRVNLPPALFNDSSFDTHTIRLTLDAEYLCEVPHVARLTIHPSSYLSLAYHSLPVPVDLSLYPYPFFQRSFEPDDIRFVLPDQSTEAELKSAMAVAAKLGDLAYGATISATTDLDIINLLDELGTEDAFYEHLFVFGRPETNRMILQLNQLNALPVPLRERQLQITAEGPVSVVPGGILTYTLTLSNTTNRSLSALSLASTMPDGQIVECDPICSEPIAGEALWNVPTLRAGESFSCVLDLRLSDTITETVVENTVTLIDASSGPLNASTLTTTVYSNPVEFGLKSATSNNDGYFFVQEERAISENDGVLQLIVSPWDQSRAILVITGLSDEAISKAGQAMGTDNHKPRMNGPVALVKSIRPSRAVPPTPLNGNVTFADLGYTDRILRGYDRETGYYFDIPFDWKLTQATLDLRFKHTQIIDFVNSYLDVLFNNEPIVTIPLDAETALDGEIKIDLPLHKALSGGSNKISVRAVMRLYDQCAPIDSTDIWLSISSTSSLHLNHTIREVERVELSLYPSPFTQSPDLSDLLFVLPSNPTIEELEYILKLISVFGHASNGSEFAPVVTLGKIKPEVEMGDYHIVAMGRPSLNPVIQQLNEHLPQPFLLDSDRVETKWSKIIFRLPVDVSLGYVELIPSPWNASRSVLFITGTSDEGVIWAARSLVSGDSVRQLSGNLVVVRDRDIQSIDTRELTRGGLESAMSTAIPELTLTVTVPPTTILTSTSEASPESVEFTTASGNPNRPTWLTPLVVVVGLIVVGIFGFAIWQNGRRS